MLKPHTRKKLLLLALSTAVCLLSMEIVLRFVFPIRVTTIGLREAPKAARYGWALNPHQLIKILDPDNGEVYTDYANSEGWRDREQLTKATQHVAHPGARGLGNLRRDRR